VQGLYRDVTDRLLQLEQEMQRLQLWSAKPPDPLALASQQPFCVDTLSLPEWLQHVFLPTLRNSIERGCALPEKCQVAPMAEMYCQQLRLQQDIDGANLIAILEGIDLALNARR
jgi:uncharacterized protein YqcC (DUF446 family)